MHGVVQTARQDACIQRRHFALDRCVVQWCGDSPLLNRTHTYPPCCPSLLRFPAWLDSISAAGRRSTDAIAIWSHSLSRPPRTSGSSFEEGEEAEEGERDDDARRPGSAKERSGVSNVQRRARGKGARRAEPGATGSPGCSTGNAKRCTASGDAADVAHPSPLCCVLPSSDLQKRTRLVSVLLFASPLRSPQSSMAALPVAAAVAEASSSSAAGSGVTQHIIGGIPVYLDYAHHLQTVPNTHPAPFLLRSYIDQHAKAGQQGYVYKDGCQFQLQLRAGPLSMSFYHVQGGEAWIYVMTGAAQLRVISERDVQQLSLPTGMCYLVPGNSPYSLQCISAETRVLIMTRQRKTDSSYPNYNKTHVSPHLANLNNNAVEPLDPQDQMLWMCGKCGAVAHKKSFECVDYSQTTNTHDRRSAAACGTRSDSCCLLFV